MSDPNYFDKSAKAYVKFVLDELKISPSRLAKMANISPTTLTRALNDPTHKFSLSMTTLGKIYKACGINFHPFFESQDFAELSLAPFTSKTMYDDSWGSGANATEDDLAKVSEGSTIVIGVTGAGIWKTPELVRIEDEGLILLSVSGVREADTFALRVGDDTGEPFVHKGEHVICTRRKAEKWSLGHGDLVVVERRRDEGYLMEITLRRVIETPNGNPHLRFDNPETKIKEIIEMDHDFKDRADLKIIGSVNYVVRRASDDSFTDEAYRYGFRRTSKTE